MEAEVTRRLCRCHNQPMQPNGPNTWRCVVRRKERDATSQAVAARRVRQSRFYHEKRKHDPVWLLYRQLANMTRVRVSY